jgi:hypothetical protein
MFCTKPPRGRGSCDVTASSQRSGKLASPIKISKILTDNGSQFTDRFAAKDKKPSGQHADFTELPQALQPPYSTARHRHQNADPSTQGMATAEARIIR